MDILFVSKGGSFMRSDCVVHWKHVALPFAINFEDWPRVGVTILCFSITFSVGKSEALRDAIVLMDTEKEASSEPPVSTCVADEDVYPEDEPEEEAADQPA